VRQVAIPLGLALLLAMPAMAQTPAQEPTQAPAQAPAQTPAQAPDKTPAKIPAQAPPQATRSRFDVSAGYTYMSYDQQDEPRLNMNGYNLGADVNLLKWLHVGATLSGDYNSQSSTNPGLNGTKTDITSFMAGPRIYFRGRRHQRSYFFDGDVGVSAIGVTPPYLPPLPQTTSTGKVFSWGFGAGLDYAISPRFAARGQVDLLKTAFFGGPSQNNVVAWVSIVYHVPRIKLPKPPTKKKK
jgi:opacity protein-like surface antigen